MGVRTKEVWPWWWQWRWYGLETEGDAPSAAATKKTARKKEMIVPRLDEEEDDFGSSTRGGLVMPVMVMMVKTVDELHETSFHSFRKHTHRRTGRLSPTPSLSTVSG